MQVNQARKSANMKLVYAGGAGSGKTANLSYIFNHAEQSSGGIESIRDSNDQTLLFDFAPFTSEKIAGYDLHFQVYTLPGRMDMQTPLELGFTGMDGMVLVVDSRWKALEQNVAYYESMRLALETAGLDMAALPHVVQYNKRDEPDTAPIPYLEVVFNKFNTLCYEASAVDGRGVFDTLNGLVRLVLPRFIKSIQTSSGTLPEFARIW